MDRMEIGKILKPQGIKGEIKAEALTDDATRFYNLDYIYAEDERYEILNVRVSGSEVYLTLSGIADRDAAELLRGKSLWVLKEDAVPLAEGRYYIADMIGCEVSDNEGKLIGVVKDVLQYGAADIIVLTEGIMFPFLKDVALEVDTRSKRMIVDRKRFQEVTVSDEN